MAESTDKDIAFQLIGMIEPLGVQWGELEKAVRSCRPSGGALAVLRAFGMQLVQIQAVMREAAGRLGAPARTAGEPRPDEAGNAR